MQEKNGLKCVELFMKLKALSRAKENSLNQLRASFVMGLHADHMN